MVAYLVACSTLDSNAPDPTFTAVTGAVPEVLAGYGGFAVGDADLVLPADLFPETWNGFNVVGDLSADGGDDVVGTLFESGPGWSYYASTRTKLQVWPDVLAGAPSWTIESPAARDDGYARDVGVAWLWPIPDATSDGQVDAWVLDRTGVATLIPGPLATTVLDPSLSGVATFIQGYISRTTDLDHDGTGEILFSLYDGTTGAPDGVARCEGPFNGPVGVGDCPLASHPDWMEQNPLAEGDVDGDGIDDILVDAHGLWDGDGFGDVTELQLYDGAFTDGTIDPKTTIHPATTRYFYPDDDRAAVGDLDADGFADVVWVEEPDAYASDDGEIAVLHGPLTAGAEYELTDAQLHLVGLGSQAVISGIANGAAGGPARLALEQPQVALSVDAFPPMVLDGSLQGTIDLESVAVFLAADGIVALDGVVQSDALVGDFDGDAMGDVLVVDLLGEAGWIYLGASLP